MVRIGIVGAGVAGLQLGLFLQQHGIDSTIYTERTPEQVRAQRLTNVVCRNGLTRARERALGVNHWDSDAPALARMSVSIARGPQPIAFSGDVVPAANVVDMRIYWSTLLEDYVRRGGRVAIRTLAHPEQVDALAVDHELMVVASGRGRLSQLFPARPEHSPFAKPQRTYVAGFFRGVSSAPSPGFTVRVHPGHGEILDFPVHSFEPGLTGIAFGSVSGGAFEHLPAMHATDGSSQLETALLIALREYAPDLYARIDTMAFALTRPLDLAHVAITPVVRCGWAPLSRGRFAVAVGDAHVLLDPLTGQGANNASHSAWVLGEAIRDAERFDRQFCETVEQRMCAHAVPVSDACNARLQPPAPHVVQFMQAAALHPALANIYTDGFNHPARFWKEVASNPEGTAALLAQFTDERVPA